MIISDCESQWEWPNQSLPKKTQPLWTRVCTKLNSRLQTHRLGIWYQQNQIWKWKSDSTHQFLQGPGGTYEKGKADTVIIMNKLLRLLILNSFTMLTLTAHEIIYEY